MNAMDMAYESGRLQAERDHLMLCIMVALKNLNGGEYDKARGALMAAIAEESK